MNIIPARPAGVCLHGRLSSNVRPHVENIIAPPKPPKYIGAKVGLAVAAATIALIVYRLADATGPVPTGVSVESQSAVSVESLRIEGNEVLPRGWASPAQSAASAGAAPIQATVGLRVGRSVAIAATLSGPGSPTAACTIEPRPHGECFLRTNFISSTELRCSFECTTEPHKR